MLCSLGVANVHVSCIRPAGIDGSRLGAMDAKLFSAC
jgi:hypothetical protein